MGQLEAVRAFLTLQPKLIDAKGVQGRYVRCYSRGNNANDLNNYVEVEVYGTPVK